VLIASHHNRQKKIAYHQRIVMISIHFYIHGAVLFSSLLFSGWRYLKRFHPNPFYVGSCAHPAGIRSSKSFRHFHRLARGVAGRLCHKKCLLISILKNFNNIYSCILFCCVFHFVSYHKLPYVEVQQRVPYCNSPSLGCRNLRK